jgi:hypothetical protein
MEYSEKGATTLQPTTTDPAMGMLLLLLVGSGTTIAVVACAMSLHATAWIQFFSNVMEMMTHASLLSSS